MPTLLRQANVNVNMTCVISCSDYIYELTFKSGGRACGSGGVTAGRDKPETTVQDHVSTFVSVKPLDNSNKLLIHILMTCCASLQNQKRQFWLVVTKPSKPKHDNVLKVGK